MLYMILKGYITFQITAQRTAQICYVIELLENIYIYIYIYIYI